MPDYVDAYSKPGRRSVLRRMPRLLGRQGDCAGREVAQARRRPLRAYQGGWRIIAGLGTRVPAGATPGRRSRIASGGGADASFANADPATGTYANPPGAHDPN